MPLAGSLDRRLTILRRVQTGTSSLNEPQFEWQTLRTVWAQKIARSEAEEFDGDTKQRAAVIAVSFKTRWMGDLLETDRLNCEGVTYDIKGLRELGRRDGLEISALKVP